MSASMLSSRAFFIFFARPSTPLQVWRAIRWTRPVRLLGAVAVARFGRSNEARCL